MSDHPPLHLGEFLPYRLSVAAEAVSRVFADRYEARFGLGIPEWRVMAVLGEHAPRTTQDVIDRTGMDRVRVSRAAIRLEDKGLIERRPHPEDRRAHLLALSQPGLAIYAEIVPLARTLQAELSAALDPAERLVLDRALAKLQACGARLVADAA